MKRTVIILAFLAAFTARAQTVRVAAAANLRFVFDEIRTLYTGLNPGSTLVVNFGSSGALVQQILNGAEFDVFMAADNTFPAKLKDQGATTGEIKTYALGKLVLWSNSMDLSKGLQVLVSKSVKHIAVAKPDLAPYGDRAIECLKSAGIFEQVRDKIVYADNISQTAQFAQTGNAEVGFLALSLTLTTDMKGSVFELDPKSYQPVEQAMVLLKTGEHNPEAAKFMKFVLSDKCQALFEKYGYRVRK